MKTQSDKSTVKTGYLCVDFLNTEYTAKGALIERLPTAEKVVEWLLKEGVFSQPADLALLESWRQKQPDQIIARFHALRSDLRQLLTALRGQQTLPAAELARLQTLLKSGYRSSYLALEDDHWHLHSRLELQRPEQVGVPFAESFAELLVAADAERIKECANPRCSVLFYDTTKNQSRAWCDSCSSRVKALRYYHNQKTKA